MNPQTDPAKLFKHLLRGWAARLGTPGALSPHLIENIISEMREQATLLEKDGTLSDCGALDYQRESST